MTRWWEELEHLICFMFIYLPCNLVFAIPSILNEKCFIRITSEEVKPLLDVVVGYTRRKFHEEVEVRG